VFSYAIFCYSVLTEKFTAEQIYCAKDCVNIESLVCGDENYRPTFNEEDFSENRWIVSMIKNCWKRNPKERPGFNTILQILKNNKVIEEETTEKDDDLLNVSFRELNEKERKLKNEHRRLKEKLNLLKPSRNPPRSRMKPKSLRGPPRSRMKQKRPFKPKKSNENNRQGGSSINAPPKRPSRRGRMSLPGVKYRKYKPIRTKILKI